MKRVNVFKITFLTMSAPVFAISVIYGYFKLRFAESLNNDTITPMMIKSFVAAVMIGAILGVLNMFIKAESPNIKTMQTNKQHWASHPTKKQTIIALTVWFLGLFAVIIETTDNFQSDPFIERNALWLFATFIATPAYLSIVMNYLKNNDEKSAVFKKAILKLIDKITNPIFFTVLCVLSSYLLSHGMRVIGKILMVLAFMVIILWLNNFIDKKLKNGGIKFNNS